MDSHEQVAPYLVQMQRDGSLQLCIDNMDEVILPLLPIMQNDPAFLGKPHM